MPKIQQTGIHRRFRLSRNAWKDARAIMWGHRRRLAAGLVLILASRLSGLVLPATSKWLMDEVVGKQRWELLWILAGATAVATLVQGSTNFALSQVLGAAAQHAITDLRRDIEAHVIRLPIRYFDSTKTGALISRIMYDADAIRNLVGMGLVQLSGSTLTAVLAFGVLMYLNWTLTTLITAVLAAYGGGLALVFSYMRPLFRERGRLNAELTGRLSETLSGVRIVKTYTAERREDLVFTRGAHKLFRNVATTITGMSATTTVSILVVGLIGIIMIVIGGNSIRSGSMTIGSFVMYLIFIGMMASPVMQLASVGTQLTEAFAGLDRIREIRLMPTEDDEDVGREPLPATRGHVEFETVSFE